MNVPCVNEDEDFPVFKAGPPLPIRTKTKPNCKIKGTPLKATSSVPPRNSLKHGTIVAQTSTNPSISAESKVKQYIEKVKASDELGRKKRIKPEQMLSLEELYQVNEDTKDSDSKFERLHSSSKSSIRRELSLTDVQDKLRETMRIVKEKDELINKLRESCHDLAIKCADAENRVDELRFSYGRSSFSAPNDKDNATVNQENSQPLPQISSVVPRRCVSAEGLNTCGVVGDDDGENRGGEKLKWEKIDKATETSYEVMKYDAHTQIETTTCAANQCGKERLSAEQDEDILQETCSNWLEKVQNWKTDSTFNLSQDSGGDKDSGFRGSSAEIDAESILKNRHLSIKSHRKCQVHSEKLHKGLSHLCPQKISTTHTVQVPQMSSSSTATITARAGCSHHLLQNHEEEPHSTQQHFWPSFSSSQSHFHFNNCPTANFHGDSTKAKSLFYEMAEAERNKYACFQEGCTGRHPRSEFQTHRLGGAKSLDVLYIPPPVSQSTTEELKSLIDSSFDPPEYILKSYLDSQHRSVDKKVKILGPLLDDTTQIALRVKMKTERLAKMLDEACTLE